MLICYSFILCKKMPGYKGSCLVDVVKTLELVAPLRLAANWDNVGLLMQPTLPHVVKKLMLTNDLTQPVLAEALKTQTNMIFSYHPPIFQSLKRLTQENVKQKIVIQCLENRIAVFSPHTSHDILDGGVNDWLLAAFDVENKQPVTVSDDIVGVDKAFLSLQEFPRLEGFGGTDIVTDHGTICYVSRNATAGMRPEALRKVGAGREGSLKAPITLSQAISQVKSHLKLPHLRVAVGEGKTLEDEVWTVACCAGSGSSVLRDCNADVYLTGEMSHHDVLHATSHGHSVILCEHSNTERGYLSRLQSRLSADLPLVECFVSSVDADPLVIM